MMKTSLLSMLLLISTGLSGYAQEVSGKEIFSGNCQACHSIGGGDVLGPDLAGLSTRREADWIRSFIANSQKMVKEGDEVAVALFEKYNKIAMPAHNFSEEELNSLVSYIEEAGHEASAAPAQAEAAPTEETDQQQVVQGSAESGPNLWVKLILGLLGVSAILLSVTTIYLVRVLKS